jgi:hypothetical protein
MEVNGELHPPTALPSEKGFTVSAGLITPGTHKVPGSIPGATRFFEK